MLKSARFFALAASEFRSDVKVLTFNNALHHLSKLGKLDKALTLYETMRTAKIEGDVVTISTLVNAYCKQNRVSDAIQFLNENKHIKANVYAYTSIINSLCERRDFVQAEKILTTMIVEGIDPNTHTLNCFIKGYVQTGDIVNMNHKIREMKKFKVLPDATTYNMMISMHCGKGQIVTALKILNSMKVNGHFPDAPSFNTLIRGCVERKNMKMAHQIVGLMNEMGVMPDVFTFTNLISGTLEVDANLHDAFSIFDNMLQSYVRPGLITFNVLLDGIAKYGSMSHAYHFYGQVRKSVMPDCYTASSILDCCQRNGSLDDLKIMFQKLLDDQVQLNSVNYTIYLFAILAFQDYQFGETEFTRIMTKFNLPARDLSYIASNYIERMRSMNLIQYQERAEMVCRRNNIAFKLPDPHVPYVPPKNPKASSLDHIIQ